MGVRFVLLKRHSKMLRVLLCYICQIVSVSPNISVVAHKLGVGKDQMVSLPTV